MIRLPRTGVLPALAWLAVMSTACGVSLQKLPSGPGTVATDAATALSQAVSVCQTVQSLSAEMRVSGNAGGQRLRGRVLVGLAAPASALLDAAAPFGASLFIYAARDGAATLLLPRDRRLLEHGDPAGVLAAVTGVPLGPDDLRLALTGCVGSIGPMTGRAYGDAWRAVTLQNADVFLRRAEAGRWRVAAVVHTAADAGWRADYSEFAADLPRAVRLSSADGHRFDLRLTLAQVEVNPALPPETFAIRAPAGFEPITLDELRRNGPMADPAP